MFEACSKQPFRVFRFDHHIKEQFTMSYAGQTVCERRKKNTQRLNTKIPEHFNGKQKLRTLKINNTDTENNSIFKLLTQSLHDDCIVEVRNLSQGGEVNYNLLQEAINFCIHTNRIICQGVDVVQFTVEQIKHYLKQVEIKK